MLASSPDSRLTRQHRARGQWHIRTSAISYGLEDLHTTCTDSTSRLRLPGAEVVIGPEPARCGQITGKVKLKLAAPSRGTPNGEFAMDIDDVQSARSSLTLFGWPPPFKGFTRAASARFAASSLSWHVSDAAGRA